jgi:hypothetical protein
VDLERFEGLIKRYRNSAHRKSGEVRKGSCIQHEFFGEVTGYNVVLNLLEQYKMRLEALKDEKNNNLGI